MGLRNEIFAILGAFGVVLLSPAVSWAEDLTPAPVAYLAADAAELVDLIAADFYEHRLAATQAAAIEDMTAARYRALPERDRKAFLRARAASWRAMAPEARARASNAARPRFDNLTEEQKAPFRAHAQRYLFDAQSASSGQHEI